MTFLYYYLLMHTTHHNFYIIIYCNFINNLPICQAKNKDFLKKNDLKARYTRGCISIKRKAQGAGRGKAKIDIAELWAQI